MDGLTDRCYLAQTLDQIITALNPGYDPQRALIQQQQAALPGQYQAQQQGLQAQDAQANQDILSQAQQRGLGFSGIPVGEQAKYNATTFMPAMAKLQSDQLSQQNGLADQLNKLNADQRTQAFGMQQNQQAQDLEQQKFAEQQRQFNLNYALQQQAAKRAASGGGGIGIGGGAPAAAPPSLAQAIQQGFRGYTAALGRANPGYAEKLISNLVADYGGNPTANQQIAGQVYGYRKSNFGV